MLPPSRPTGLRSTFRALNLAPTLTRIVGLAVGGGLLVVGLADGCTSSRRLGAVTPRRPEPAAVAVLSAPPVAPVTSAPPAAAAPAPPPAVSSAVAYALAQVGRPYRFGAAGPDAFDCSGLTRAAYLTTGIALPHRAAWQARQGRAVAWRTAGILPGDLVLTPGGRPRRDLGHVGLAVSPTEWVVAPSPGQRVRREPIPAALVQEVRRVVPA